MAVAPGIAIDDVVGASFCADDGIADPAGLTQGYATLARRSGADVRLGVEVVEIQTSGARRHRSPHGGRLHLRARRGERGRAVGRDACGDRRRYTFHWNPSRGWS